MFLIRETLNKSDGICVKKLIGPFGKSDALTTHDFHHTVAFGITGLHPPLV
jgi:hypothetical protein